MLNRGVLLLLIAALAVLAAPGLAPPAAANPTRWLVGADSASCAGQVPDFATIFEAILIASPGDTIHVCPGDYTEPSMTIYDNELIIEGSGASVTHVHRGGGSWVVFNVVADYVVVQGLDVDATAPPGDASYGFVFEGDSVTIENNEIRNATEWAVVTSPGAKLRYAQVLSNNIHDSKDGVHCTADDCVVSGNTVNVGGGTAIQVFGNNGNITSNVVVNGSVVGVGDDLFASDNQISGPIAGPLLYVAGNRVGVTGNTLSDTAGYGIWAAPASSGTSVTIARNTFTHIDTPIYLYDQFPADGSTLTATISGSASEANTFIDSGGSLGDSSYLVQMDGPTIDVNATYNNWGLCTLAEIEQEIFHQVDDPAQGVVDYDPFIAPSGCSSTPTPTATSTRTSTPTPTATPGGTATPTPGPTRTVTIPAGSWANFAWTGDSSPQTVADCFGAGNVAVMYRLDAATGSFQRWVRDRDDLSNMGDVQRFDALLALNTSAQPATCIMPDDVIPHSLTIPAGRWANFAWLANSFPADIMSEACGEGSIAVAYRLDALTQTFQRWIGGRPDLSNMTDVLPYDALLALNASGQPTNCSFSHYGQLATTSS